MIYNNKALNLEQQVLKNKNDIEYLKTLGLGLKINGYVNTFDELPNEAEKGYLFYVLDTLELYLFDESWINLGKFPKEGPQGQQGIQGNVGPQGISSRWFSGLKFPNAKDSKAGDMFLDISTCQVYMFNGSIWVSKVNIKGASGRDGLNGIGINEITSTHSESNKETTIVINYTNNQTASFKIPDGKPGTGFHVSETKIILSELPYNIVNILTEEYPPSNYDYSDAILVKCVYLDNSVTKQESYIFVLIDSGTSKIWDNAGQIESVQGPAGKDGNEIINSQDIISAEVSGQPDNYKQLFIDNIPYLTSSPNSDNPIQENRNGFKIVVLPKSLENETVKYNGYLYIFKEE